METRSSPSLQQLQRLARQAHISAQDISLLSKPALFSHLQSNFDYHRLERAHQITLKRSGGSNGNDHGGSGGNTNSNCSSSRSNSDSRMGIRKKRQCRAAVGADDRASVSSSSSSEATPTASTQEQGLPPASVFDQTRSHSRRMLLAVDGSSSNSNSNNKKVKSSRTSMRCGTTRHSAASGRPSTSPRPRVKCKLADGNGEGSSNRGSGSGSGSGSISHSDRDSGSISCSDIDNSTGNSSDRTCGAETAAEGKAGSDKEESEGAENTAKRKAQQQQQQQQQEKGKGKGKARESCDGEGAKDRPLDPNDSSSGDINGKEVANNDSNLPNQLDPIMLVEIGKDHFRFVRPNGRVVVYNLDSLVDYFISTGDFLEPETRLPFSDDHLRAIDLKARAAGLSKPSVLEAKRDPGRYAKQKFQQDALVGLERMTSELVTGMLSVVELCDREEGEIRLVTEIFPPFTDLFKQIWAADRAFALQCMEHYTSWLEGPPNRPTEDEMGFLDIILSFLKQLQECGGQSSLGF